MGRRQVDQVIKQMLMSGYGHYSRANEKRTLTAYLLGDDTKFIYNSINEYQLTIQHLRSIKTI